MVVENADDLDNKDICEYTIKAKTPQACPNSQFYAVWDFLKKNFVVSGCILLIVGLALGIFGFKIDRITIFIVGVLSTTAFIFILTFQFILHGGTSQTVVWVVFGFGVAIGIIIGFVMASYRKLFYGLLGALLGVIFANVLYLLVLRLIESNPQVVYWLTMVFSVLVFILLTLLVHKYLVIIGTSIIGSYMFIRGISLFAGGFPNESYIIDCINSGEDEQIKELFKPALFAYLASFLVLSILCIFIQVKINNNTESWEEDNDDKEESIVKDDDKSEKLQSMKTKKSESEKNK